MSAVPTVFKVIYHLLRGPGVVPGRLGPNVVPDVVWLTLTRPISIRPSLTELAVDVDPAAPCSTRVSGDCVVGISRRGSLRGSRGRSCLRRRSG